MDVFEFAMEMELDGKAHYEKLASEASVDGLKAIFTNLAEDEQKHYDTIKAIQAGADWKMTESQVLDKAKNLFQGMIDNTDIANSLAESLYGYQYARGIEAKSISYYEDAAKKADNPEIEQLLLQIANEEKKHYNIMDNLCDFTLKPKYFLAWREFSNLKPL
jgi:rubrerythrin